MEPRIWLEELIGIRYIAHACLHTLAPSHGLAGSCKAAVCHARQVWAHRRAWRDFERELTCGQNYVFVSVGPKFHFAVIVD